MIPKVRIDSSHFLGSNVEELIWDSIKNAKEKCKREFRLNFHAKDQQSIIKLTDSCQHHLESLQIKTKIQLEENSKKEFVFLDVHDGDNRGFRKFRFSFGAPPPTNIVGAMRFLIDHFDFLNKTPHLNSKKQKRNDSTTFDYNKK